MLIRPLNPNPFAADAPPKGLLQQYAQGLAVTSGTDIAEQPIPTRLDSRVFPAGSPHVSGGAFIQRSGHV